MSNSTTIPESHRDLVIEKANMIGMILSTLVYGAHVVLFLATLRHYIYPPSCGIKKPGRWLLAYISFLFLLASAGFILLLQWDLTIFIDHRNFPGGPLAYLQQEGHSSMNLAVTAIYLILNWFADGMLLFRFCVIFKRNRIAVISSCATLIALIDIARLNVNLWTNAPAGYAIGYLAMSLSLNVILTSLISGRILYWRHYSLEPRTKGIYAAVVVLLVESTSMYTVVAIISIITLGTSSPVQIALLPLLGQMQAIPPILTTQRVLSGRALSEENFQSTGIFSVDAQATTEQTQTKSPALDACDWAEVRASRDLSTPTLPIKALIPSSKRTSTDRIPISPASYFASFETIETSKKEWDDNYRLV
ncbi:hypothetical protein AcV5_000312 [Taiwanofungus camphoratus]|nr:hypothetical protein AcV5_000312 [Antrodia cinnamomea]